MEKISFYQLIQETIKDPSIWDYYDMNIDFDINKKQDCLIFIKAFFKHSKKIKDSELLTTTINSLSDYRLKHILSVFFFGLGIFSKEKKIQEKLNERIKYYSNLFKCKSECNFNFNYIWFLLCLFHDIGYLQEDKNKEEYKEILKDVKIDTNVENFKMDNPIGVPNCYHNVISNYYKWKKERLSPEKYRGVDHGIYGGKYLYITLKNLRDTEYNCNPDEKRTNDVGARTR